jgi:four helix bundle protein
MAARIRGDLQERTLRFGLSILSLVDDLPKSVKGWEVGKQVIRSGTGIGANIREADNALTDAEFAHKCSIARKEASETQYWLELCRQAKLLSGPHLEAAMQEANELTRIMSAMVIKTQHYIAGDA